VKFQGGFSFTVVTHTIASYRMCCHQQWFRRFQRYINPCFEHHITFDEVINKGVVERSLIKPHNHCKTVFRCPGAAGGDWCGSGHPAFVKQGSLTRLPRAIATRDCLLTHCCFDADRTTNVGKIQREGFDLKIVRIDLVSSTFVNIGVTPS